MSEASRRRSRFDRAFVLAGFLLVALAAFGGSFLRRHIVFNATPSLPEGFYRLHHRRADVGDLVWFEAPTTIQALSVARGYLPADAHFAKRVIANAGTTWCVRSGRFTVDGTTYGPVYSHDSEGRTLPQSRGCHEVPDGHVLVGTRHDHSIDSRYFGSVSRTDIRGTLRRLWTWRPVPISRTE